MVAFILVMNPKHEHSKFFHLFRFNLITCFISVLHFSAYTVDANMFC